MLRKYAFNNINESEVNNDVFEKAIQNVKNTGLFERILRDKCKYRDFDGFKLIFIYGFNDGASDENNLVVCDANDGHIIFKDPVNDVYRYKGMTDYALVRRYDGRFPQYNLINKDGIVSFYFNMKYKTSPKFAFQIGLGSFFGEHVSASLHYSGYGKRAIKYTDKTEIPHALAEIEEANPGVQSKKAGLFSLRIGFHF